MLFHHKTNRGGKKTTSMTVHRAGQITAAVSEVRIIDDFHLVNEVSDCFSGPYSH